MRVTARSPRSTLALRLLGVGTLAGSVAVAVPTIQGLVLWRTKRPPVPGPHDQDGVVGSLDGDPGAGAAPMTVVWLGDSLASGVGAGSPDSSFPRLAAALCSSAERRSVHLTCLARPGACTADVLREQVPTAVERLGPGSVAVVTVGSNDVGSFNRPRRFRRQYTTLLDQLSSTGASVVAVGLPHMGSAKVMARPLRTIIGLMGNHADRQVRRLADQGGAHYVKIADRARGAKPLTYLAADRWHPNDDTYRSWAMRVAPLLALACATAAPPAPSAVADQA